MLRRLLPALSTLGIALFPYAPLSSTTVVSLSFPDLVAQAELIVVGEVSDTEARWVPRDGGDVIVTQVRFRVLETWKGRSAPSLELEFLGGTVGDVTLSVSDMLVFRVGDRDVLFVESTSERFVSPVVGFMQGRFRLPEADSHLVTLYDGTPLRHVDQIGTSKGVGPRLVIGPLDLAAFRAAVRAQIAARDAR